MRRTWFKKLSFAYGCMRPNIVRIGARFPLGCSPFSSASLSTISASLAKKPMALSVTWVTLVGYPMKLRDLRNCCFKPVSNRRLSVLWQRYRNISDGPFC